MRSFKCNTCYCFSMWENDFFDQNRPMKKLVYIGVERVCAFIMAACILICAVLLPIIPAFAKEPEEGSKVVRIGWYDSSYCYEDEYGKKNGFAYEYQQKLVAYTGWTYEYVDGTWSELYEMLVNGEIDILSDVSHTKEREEKILYSDIPMGSETYYIFAKAGNKDISPDDLSSFSGKVFATNSDSIMEDLTLEWGKKNGIEFELRPIKDKSIDESFEMLENGEIDAYVTIESYGNRENIVPVCPVGASEFYFAVSKNRPDLLKELNSALNNIQHEDPYYSQKLLQKYFWSASTNTYLTDKELEWIEEHGKIRVGYRNNYMPFCSNSMGNLTGALGDFMSEASSSIKNADIEFEFFPYATTDGALEAMSEGEIDIVFPINLSPYEMERRGLLGTEYFMHTEVFAVVNPNSSKDIFTGEDVKVVLLSGNVNFDNFVQDFFPNWTIEHKDNLDACYKAVALGEADCAMVNSYRITQNDRLRRRYKLELLATGHDMDFAFALEKDDQVMYSIINKTINLADAHDIEANLSRYSGNVRKVTFKDYIEDNAISFALVTTVICSIIIFLMFTKIRADKKASDRQRLISATELDPLTNLYTRNYFMEYAAIMHSENPDKKYNAIVINIEKFHVVNSLYGWDFGDKVLKALGDEIKAFIKENGGIACRSSADRFNIYSVYTEDHNLVYERFQQALDIFSENVSIRLRMGIMPYSIGIEPMELFDRARTACSLIRNGSHEMVRVFNEEMREKEIIDQRLLNDLKTALLHNEFLVYYQPKYNVQVDPPVIESAEALVRWKHHELGMIPPGKFIDLFEKHGEIGLVDRFVWQETARQISEWKKKYGVAIPVSVNLSRIDFFDSSLVDTIEGIVAKNGLDRTDLHLEVTESAYTDDTEQLIGVVKKLREHGYIIEMDDFGTGYSSLHMLSAMPVDILKLDKRFVDKLEKSKGREEDIRLVELILDIARNLNLSVVAEGVEQEEQLVFLKERGCEMIQGYYFSPALPANVFEELVFCKRI